MSASGGRSAERYGISNETLAGKLMAILQRIANRWRALVAIFRRLVDPRDPSLSVEERMRVIVLNTLLLTVVPVVPVIALAAASFDLSDQSTIPPVLITLVGTAGLALCYPIHRSGRYRLARWAAMGIAMAIVYAQVEISAPPYADVLYFLTLPAAGIILFSRRENLALSVLVTILMLWTLSRKPGVTLSTSYDLVVISVLLSFLLLVASLYRDALEQRRSRALVQQEGQLQLERERLRLLAEFLQSASHDLRTPISQITLSAHLLARVDSVEARERHQRSMNTAVGTLQTLLDRMFYVVELERLSTTARHPVRCDDLLKGVAAYAGPRAEKAGITFTHSVPGDLPVLQGYTTELHRALTELVDNALEHTPAGGSITLRADRDAGALLIELADTGEGIPADALPRVFDMMYRVEAHRPNGGQHSGLGLPIARKIIAQHGGLITLDSTVGKGTVVQIRLPL